MADPDQNATIAIGDCFRYAVGFAQEHNDASGSVVHSKIYDPIENKSYWHAWVELDDLVYDWQTDIGLRKQYTVDEFWEYFGVEDPISYDFVEAIVNSIKTGHYGPWTEAEITAPWRNDNPRPRCSYGTPWDWARVYHVFGLSLQNGRVIPKNLSDIRDYRGVQLVLRSTEEKKGQKQTLHRIVVNCGCGKTIAFGRMVQHSSSCNYARATLSDPVELCNCDECVLNDRWVSYDDCPRRIRLTAKYGHDGMSRHFYGNGVEPNLIKNPLLHKGDKTAYLGEQTVKERAAQPQILDSDIKENVIIAGPFGKGIAQMFGFHSQTHVLYFLIDPADRPVLVDKIVNGDKMPIFPMHRAGYGAPGTIPQFWASDRKFTNKLAGACQFVNYDDEKILLITHMSVKPAWRRQGLNTLIVNAISQEYPDFEIIFDDPTSDGKKFHKSFGRGKLGERG